MMFTLRVFFSLLLRSFDVLFLQWTQEQMAKMAYKTKWWTTNRTSLCDRGGEDERNTTKCNTMQHTMDRIYCNVMYVLHISLFRFFRMCIEGTLVAQCIHTHAHTHIMRIRCRYKWRLHATQNLHKTHTKLIDLSSFLLSVDAQSMDSWICVAVPTQSKPTGRQSEQRHTEKILGNDEKKERMIETKMRCNGLLANIVGQDEKWIESCNEHHLRQSSSTNKRTIHWHGKVTDVGVAFIK